MDTRVCDPEKGGTMKAGVIMNVLVVDIGGSHVKILAIGQNEPRTFVSGLPNGR